MLNMLNVTEDSLCKESEKAKFTRTYLLNVEEIATPEQRTEAYNATPGIPPFPFPLNPTKESIRQHQLNLLRSIEREEAESGEVTLFSRRAVLLTCMLLPESEPAKHVRKYLLKLERIVEPEQRNLAEMAACGSSYYRPQLQTIRGGRRAKNDNP